MSIMSGELYQKDKVYSAADLEAAYKNARKDAYTNITAQQATQQPHQPPPEEEGGLVGSDNKLVKQLQNTVGIFNALKEFSSNPLQKAIEQKIGNVAATVVEDAFSPRGSHQKRDLMDTILNSQFAYGLGSGIGQRAPEVIKTLTSSFGTQKVEQVIDNLTSSNKNDESAGVERLLSLDRNNPEHVAAYAESQGGISIDVARKMLIIHQGDMIKRMSPKESAAQSQQYQQSQSDGQYANQPEQYVQQPEQYVQPKQVYQQPRQEPIQHRPPLQEGPEITEFPTHKEPIQQSEQSIQQPSSEANIEVNDIDNRWGDEDEKPQDVETKEGIKDEEVVDAEIIEPVVESEAKVEKGPTTVINVNSIRLVNKNEIPKEV